MTNVIKSQVTREQVVDMAWKTEGLVRLMRNKGDERAVLLEIAQLDVLLSSETDSLKQGQINKHYQLMEVLATEYKFDSGNRIYDVI